MDIVCVLFEGVTALDIIGPYEVLARLPGAELRFVAPEAGPVRTDNRKLALLAEHGMDDIPRADLLLVPGGLGTRRLMRDERALRWLRAIDQTTRITASVCTGSLLLAAAGLLRGRRANTHWAVRSQLGKFGAIPCDERYVRDGKYATAAGVSAGIDLALTLAIELAGESVAQSIQLSIEYDPRPPLDAGHPERAPAAIRERLQRAADERERALAETA